MSFFTHRPFFLVLIFLLLTSCSLVSNTPRHSLDHSQEHMVGSTLWMARAAEVRALSHQAFNVATRELRSDLQKSESEKPRAVVMDVDETLLSNLPYQKDVTSSGKGYTEKSWKNWVKKAKAKPLPGALKFAKYADKQGVTCFYVTNRVDELREATRNNLRKAGFPVERGHLLTRSSKKSSSKASRREKIFKNYRVVLLLGDQLGDFSDEFEVKSFIEESQKVEKHSSKFGPRFILLPNPMYGNWLQHLYRGHLQRGEMTLPEKARVWRDILTSERPL